MSDEDFLKKLTRELDGLGALLLAGILLSLASIVIVVLLILFAPPLRGAPVPFDRPPPRRPSVVGEWSVLWSKSRTRCTFTADGRWYCVWSPESTDLWVGRWKLEGDVLEVREWPYKPGDESVPYNVFHWQVTLERGRLRGMIKHFPDAPFVLTRTGGGR